MNKLELFKLGEKFKVELKVTGEIMNQFRKLSGDENPIHHDIEYANRHGFNSPIVFGNIMGALVSKLVGVALPTPEVVILKESLDFRKPAFVDETVSLEAEVVAIHESVRAIDLKLVFNSTSTESFCTGKCLIKCL